MKKIRTSIHSAISKNKNFPTAINFLNYFCKSKKLPGFEPYWQDYESSLWPLDHDRFWKKMKFSKYEFCSAVFLFPSRLYQGPEKKGRWTWFWKTIQNGFWHFAQIHTHTKSIITKPISFYFGTWVQRYVIWTCDWPRNIFIFYKKLFSGVWVETKPFWQSMKILRQSYWWAHMCLMYDLMKTYA